jgi:hypothetical protein
MRTISSSGTLTDAASTGHTSEVIFGIEIFDTGLQRGHNLAEVTFVLRKDGQDILNGQYDLEDKVTGESFHLRKAHSGWEVMSVRRSF